VRPIVIEGRMYGMPASPEVPDGLSSSGIRTGRFKYIRYSTGEEEFYDLLNDPNELESLHNDPAYADIKAQLITVWQNRRACAGDPCRAPLPPELQLDTNDLRSLDANARAQYALYYQN